MARQQRLDFAIASSAPMDDVVQVLRASKAVLDPAYLRSWASPLGVSDLLARAQADADA
jgi:hypothetical protein